MTQPKPMPWLKMSPHRLDDPRLCALHERVQLRYYQLYLLAGKLNVGGAFILNGKSLTDKEIAIMLRIKTDEQLAIDMKVLKKAGLFSANGHGYFVSDFKDEQVNWIQKQADDRERQARKREKDRVTRDDEDVTHDDSVSHAPRTRTRTRTRPRTRTRTRTSPPTIPPSKIRNKVAGGDGAEVVDQKISKTQTKQIKQIGEILRVSGLGKSKLETVKVLMATRSSIRDKVAYTLAALASAYADNKIGNKVIVAAYRMTEDSIPPEFFDPHRWTCLPEEIISAAGITDLNAYVGKGTYANLIDTLRKED